MKKLALAALLACAAPAAFAQTYPAKPIRFIVPFPPGGGNDTMLPQVKAGRLRAIAMTGSKRSAAIPNIPTVAESGVPGYETGSWYGVVVPAATPKAAIERLSREIQGIVKSQDITSRLNEEAVIPVGSTPEAFDKHIRAELARWAKVIKAAKIELE